MAELGAGNGSDYPGTVDTDNSLEVDSPNAGKTLARAAVPNDLAAAIIAIETELGTDPAGTLADVKTYLQTEHNTDGTHKTSLVAMLAAANTFTAGPLARRDGSETGIALYRGGSADRYGIGSNMTEGSAQINAAKPSWEVKFNNDLDQLNINRIPAGGSIAALIVFDSTGKMTTGTIPLARLSAADANAGYPQSGTGGETLRTIRGFVNSSGDIVHGAGYSSVRDSTGVFTVTFTTAFSANPTLTANVVGDAGGMVYINTVSTSAIQVVTYDKDGTLANRGFMFHVIGPS